MTRLVYTLQRWGEDIEADFAHWYPGDDVGELFRRRRWRRLLGLIDRLPSTSNLVHAQLTDEELAAAMADQPKKAGDPKFTEWSGERTELRRVASLLELLINTTRQIGGNKATNFPPMPFPRSALERARVRRDRDAHERLVARLLPNKR